MANVVLVITTKDLVVPSTVVPTAFIYTITDQTGNTVTQGSNELTSTFNDVLPGVYTASVSKFDEKGNVLGEKLVQPFEIATPPVTDVTIQVPSTLTVSF